MATFVSILQQHPRMLGVVPEEIVKSAAQHSAGDVTGHLVWEQRVCFASMGPSKFFVFADATSTDGAIEEIEDMLSACYGHCDDYSFTLPLEVASW